MKSRFAPSPTGSPHVGNLRTAIYDWLLAKKLGGAFLARLEDTDRDPARYKPESVTDIETSLRFLGIVPDEWWVTGGPNAPYLQSERLPRYQEIANHLVSQGNAYRCYCTEERLAQMREERQAKGLSGYDRRCRFLSDEERADHESSGVPFVIRQALHLEGETRFTCQVYGDLSFENRLLDDPVLLKANGWPTYHLAAMVDDHDMGITHVLRGEEWLSSAPKHVQLIRALGWSEPVWVHLPLLVGTDKKKLSKRHGATTFTDFIEQGYLPEAMFNFLALLGWSPGEGDQEIFTREELVERFDIAGIQNHPAVFDFEKLNWMNGEYIRQCEPEHIAQLCLPYLQRAGFVSAEPTGAELIYAKSVCALAAERIKRLSEVVEVVEFFYVPPSVPEEKGRAKWLTGSHADQARRIITQSLKLGSFGNFNAAAIEQFVNSLAEELSISRGPIIHTLRISLTGRTTGPGLFELMEVLGPNEIVGRLTTAIGWISEG